MFKLPKSVVIILMLFLVINFLDDIRLWHLKYKPITKRILWNGIKEVIYYLIYQIVGGTLGLVLSMYIVAWFYMTFFP